MLTCSHSTKKWTVKHEQKLPPRMTSVIPWSTLQGENLIMKAEEKQTHTCTHTCTHTAPLLCTISILLTFYTHPVSGDLYSGQKLMLAGEESTLEKRGEGEKKPTVSWLVISRLDAFCGTRPKHWLLYSREHLNPSSREPSLRLSFMLYINWISNHIFRLLNNKA